MNFLAHLYLSGEDEDIILGNFIADAVKGSAYNNYPDGVRDGILLHRAIDHYTDNHPVFLRSCERLRPTYHKFAGVIVDLYYDHFLSRNWNDYSESDLKSYVAKAYHLLISRFSEIPARSRRILPFMISQNWLVGYSDFYSLKKVFAGMSRRVSFRSGMEHAVEDLQKNYKDFENEFRLFFPDIIQYVDEWLAEHRSHKQA